MFLVVLLRDQLRVELLEGVETECPWVRRVVSLSGRAVDDVRLLMMRRKPQVCTGYPGRLLVVWGQMAVCHAGRVLWGLMTHPCLVVLTATGGLLPAVTFPSPRDPPLAGLVQVGHDMPDLLLHHDHYTQGPRSMLGRSRSPRSNLRSRRSRTHTHRTKRVHLHHRKIHMVSHGRRRDHWAARLVSVFACRSSHYPSYPR